MGVFPFDLPTAYLLWKNALRKAGLEDKDGSTEGLILHPRTIRKFFRSRMEMIIPVDIVEALMVHEGYLMECYRKHT